MVGPLGGSGRQAGKVVDSIVLPRLAVFALIGTILSPIGEGCCIEANAHVVAGAVGLRWSTRERPRALTLRTSASLLRAAPGIPALTWAVASYGHDPGITRLLRLGLLHH